MHEENEWLLSIKTRCACCAALEKWLQLNHPAHTPEIIQLPIVAGARAYLDWVEENTEPPHTG